MAHPYVSTRAGGGQWLMQRVSAALLVFLAFGHFGLQHFTADAVSTGLTVAARMNDPWWQSYYIVFIALALYHGVNGVVGIVRDYAVPPRGRLLIEIGLWTLAAAFAAVGIVNIASPRALGEVKEIYARDGFAAGASRGSPPWAPAMSYDFAEELRELHLLAHYYERHTHHEEGWEEDLGEPFTERIVGEGVQRTPTPETVRSAGATFDEWARDVVERGAPPAARRDRHATFSSDYEFALWALNVRQANARRRGPGDAPDKPSLPPRKPSEPVPAYSAADAN